MAHHLVKVVDDGSLSTEDGWAMARCEDTGDIYFLVERSAASSEEVLTDAWTAANKLERNDIIERAVREGIVRSQEPGEA